MKQKILIILIFVAALISLTIASAFTVSGRVQDKNFVVKKVRENTDFKKQRYSYDTLKQEEIKALEVEIAKNPSNKKSLETKLRNQKEIVTYFKFSHQMIDYFVSYDAEKNDCRLAVVSTHPILILNFSQLPSHQIYYIEKSICNGLYGYGRPL